MSRNSLIIFDIERVNKDFSVVKKNIQVLLVDFIIKNTFVNFFSHENLGNNSFVDKVVLDDAALVLSVN